VKVKRNVRERTNWKHEGQRAKVSEHTGLSINARYLPLR
jgi:hypothetical protein